jgi:hypothetical protein
MLARKTNISSTYLIHDIPVYSSRIFLINRLNSLIEAVKLAAIENKEGVMNRKIDVFRNVIFLLILGAMLAAPNSVFSQSERTVGLIKRDIRAYEGYTLYKPLAAVPGGPVYLINNAGNPVHQWTIPLPTRPGGEVFLRKNGELVLTTDQGFYARFISESVVASLENFQGKVAQVVIAVRFSFNDFDLVIDPFQKAGMDGVIAVV